MHHRLDEMLYDNEHIRVRAERIFDLLPYQFLEQIGKLHQEIQRIKDAIK